MADEDRQHIVVSPGARAPAQPRTGKDYCPAGARRARLLMMLMRQAHQLGSAVYPVQGSPASAQRRRQRDKHPQHSHQARSGIGPSVLAPVTPNSNSGHPGDKHRSRWRKATCWRCARAGLAPTGSVRPELTTPWAAVAQSRTQTQRQQTLEITRPRRHLFRLRTTRRRQQQGRNPPLRSPPRFVPARRARCAPCHCHCHPRRESASARALQPHVSRALPPFWLTDVITIDMRIY